DVVSRCVFVDERNRFYQRLHVDRLIVYIFFQKSFDMDNTFYLIETAVYYRKLTMFGLSENLLILFKIILEIQTNDIRTVYHEINSTLISQYKQTVHEVVFEIIDHSTGYPFIDECLYLLFCNRIFRDFDIH